MTTHPNRPAVSVIVPILNERGTLVELARRVIDECRRAGRSVELLLIDDGSTDGSWQTICELARDHDEVHGIRQRRTFGKAAALSAGFQRADGDVIVTMDGDLQDDPSELPRFFAALEGDLDAVSGWKKERHDPLGKRLPSKFFNLVLRNVSGLGLHDFNCGFKAYTRGAAEALQPYVYGDMHRYLPAVLGAQGYRVGEIPVRHHARVYGESKYGVGRIFAGSFDLMTILMLTKYRYRPMHAFGALAGIVLGVALVLAAVIALLGHSIVAGLGLAVGLVLVMTLLGVGVVSELAVHGMGPAGVERRVAAVADHDQQAGALRPEPRLFVEEVDDALQALATAPAHPAPVRPARRRVRTPAPLEQTVSEQERA
jgi:glycosyltransferase involved in cell wall biosynthesis